MKKLFIILLLITIPVMPSLLYAEEGEIINVEQVYLEEEQDAIGVKTKPAAADGIGLDTTADTSNSQPATADKLDDPLGNQGSLAAAVNKLIKGVMGIVGVLAIIAFIWGGIEWMISGGSPEKIKKGKSMMVWAVWGLVVIFGSYAILDVIFRALGA